MHDLTVHDTPLKDLALLAGNPRQGDIGAVSESMRVNGVYQPIIVNRGTKTGRAMEIIAGNHRAQAAKALGHDTIPAIILDLTEEEANRIALADNRTSDLADYDNDALLLMLQSLPDLAGTGYDGDDLDDLINDLDDTEADEQGYTQAVDVPQYTPKGDQPKETDLYDTAKRDALVEEINSHDIPEDIRVFLTHAASRHTCFNYRRIADYYPHATPEVQQLMENSALVIIDFDNALRNGFVKLDEEFAHLTGDQ